MTLLREGAVVADDYERLAADDARLAGEASLTGALLVPAEAFSAAAARAAEGARIGAYGRAEGAEAEALLAAAAAGAALIAVDFPAYNDGRFFSLARRARAAGYAGALRAAGPLIPDQAWFAERVGFDEFEIPDAVVERAGLDNYAHARRSAGGRYQWGFAGERAEAPVSVLAARHAARAGNED